MRKIAIILFVSAFSLTMMAQIQDSTQVVKNTLPSPEPAKVVADNSLPTPKRSYFGMALGVSASTNGLGGSLITSLNKRFSLRLSYEKVDMTFKDAFTFEQSGKSFVATPQWKSGGMSAILDFYLFKCLYLSGGVVLSDMNLGVSLNSASDIKIGDITFSNKNGEIGQLALAVKPFDRVAPYAAIGFGRNISRDHRLGMSLEMGAYYMKSYVVDVSGTKFFEGNNNNASIDNLNATLKDISWSGIYPVVKLAISYKFIGKNK